MFNYFCFGAGCSEVEVDCLTGDHQVWSGQLCCSPSFSAIFNPVVTNDLMDKEGAGIDEWLMLETSAYKGATAVNLT